MNIVITVVDYSLKKVAITPILNVNLVVFVMLQGLIIVETKMRRILPLLSLLFLPVCVLGQDVHPEVQAALDWQIPKNECEFRVKRTNVGGGTDRSFQKAMKKHTKCNEKYLAGLVAEREKMMGVAHHGLTQEQADIIMGHMGAIAIMLKRRRSASAVPESIREANQTADFNE